MRRFFAPVLLAALVVVGILAASSRAAPLQQAGCGSGPCSYLPIVTKPESTPTGTAQPTAQPSVTPTDVPGFPTFENPGFEQGHTGWTEIPGNAIITQFSGITPHAGQWLADLGGEANSRDEIQQSIKFPSAPVFLRYYRQIKIGSGDLDINEFSIFVNDTEIRNDTLLFMDTGGQWEVDTADLSAYAGQTVTIRLHVYMDNSDVHVYLDDIALSSHS